MTTRGLVLGPRPGKLRGGAAPKGAECLRRMRHGETKEAIAAEMGVSILTVERWAREAREEERNR